MTARLGYNLLFFWLFFIHAAWADVAVPQLSKRVMDLTATLNNEQSAALENKLAAFEEKKGSQIAVLILPTTQPETIEAFGIRVFDAWKIGRKGVDDGVILIVAKDDRKLRMEVGRGLEGVIPDAIAKRILAETIKPYFKNNDYAGGIEAGTNQIISLIEGEKLPEVQAEPMTGWNALIIVSVFVLSFVVFFVIVIRGILAAFKSSPGKNSSHKRKHKRKQQDDSSSFWSNSGSTSSSSNWSSSDSSSSSSSDFSGGGGESSGGGASDSW